MFNNRFVFSSLVILSLAIVSFCCFKKYMYIVYLFNLISYFVCWVAYLTLLIGFSCTEFVVWLWALSIAWLYKKVALTKKNVLFIVLWLLLCGICCICCRSLLVTVCSLLDENRRFVWFIVVCCLLFVMSSSGYGWLQQMSRARTPAQLVSLLLCIWLMASALTLLNKYIISHFLIKIKNVTSSCCRRVNLN